MEMAVAASACSGLFSMVLMIFMVMVMVMMFIFGVMTVSVDELLASLD